MSRFGLGFLNSAPGVLVPTFVGAGAPQYILPATLDMPAGLQVGDVAVIFLDRNNTAGFQLPTGWTAFINAASHAVYYRVIDGSEASTVTVTGGSGLAGIGVICAWRNVKVQQAQIGTVYEGSSKTSFPSIGNTGPGILLGSLSAASSTSYGGLSGMTKRVDANGGVGTSGINFVMGIYDQVFSTAGATGIKTFTGGGDTSNLNMAIFLQNI